MIWINTFIQTISAAESKTSTQVFEPPHLITKSDFFTRILLIIALCLLIFISVIPTDKYKEYQIALLNGVALAFGVVEIFLHRAFKLSALSGFVFAIVTVAGFILSLKKEMKQFVSSLAAIYPTSLLIFCFLTSVMGSTLGIIIYVAVYFSVFYVVGVNDTLLDKYIVGVFNAFFSCCILEAAYVKIFTTTSEYDIMQIFHIREYLFRMLIIGLLLVFFFLPTALSLLKSFINKNNGENEGEKSSV